MSSKLGITSVRAGKSEKTYMMKIICPVCELFLVDLEIEGGFVSFFCARCESKKLDGVPNIRFEGLAHF